MDQMILKKLPETQLGIESLVRWSDTSPDVMEDEIARMPLPLHTDCDRLMIELRESKLPDTVMSIQLQTSDFTRLVPIGSLQYWCDAHEAEKLYTLCMSGRHWLNKSCNYGDSVCIIIEILLKKLDNEIRARRRTGLQATELYPGP